MKASDIMHKDFLVVSPDTTMLETGKLLYEKKVHGAVINDPTSGETIGVITEGDVIGIDQMPYDSKIVDFFDKIASMVLPVEKGVEMRDVHHALSKEDLKTDLQSKVEEYMNERLITATPDTLVEEICKTFSVRRIHFMPVMHDSKTVGVIYETDLLKHVLDTCK